MEAVEETPPSNVLEGEVVGIQFSMATCKEICTASVSDSAICHASQLSNPFLGLPLEFGRCESCGTSDAGKCEGHFGYIELPVPIYHPSHVSELKRMLSLICLSCLKMKKTKFPDGLAQRILSSSCCQDVHAAQVSIREVKTTDGACFLALKVSKSKMRNGFWNFLEKYGYHYNGDHTRALLPCEVMEMIKKLPPETKNKLSGKGYFPQDGYVLKYLPVPPNCLSVPVVSDGVSVMSSDPSITILRKLLRKVEIIRGSRSGNPNFESHQVEANDLQSVFDQYLQVRGTSKAARDIETHYSVKKDLNDSSTKAWLEKMRTLFIRKGSGFSSRNVITGDGYKRINEIGIPLEVSQKITFEERVNNHNMSYLQKLVDENLCLTYKEGVSLYSLREGSKGHIYLKPGQIVHRRIMDGDIVFINRPPTTHKHSLQALSVYIHDDHTVKINPLICGPLGADFDGDCIHLFYPQSLAAKAEVLELFCVEKQLLSSHSGNLNLQLTSDSLLSLKNLMRKCYLDRATVHQLAMFLSLPLPHPTFRKGSSGDSYWSSIQILQCTLPPSFDCTGGRYMIRQSEILEFDVNRDILPTVINEIAASIFFGKGPKEALNFFDVIQPFLMESLFIDGFSMGLHDFSISRAAKRGINRSIGKVFPLLDQLRTLYNELVAQQLEKYLQDLERPIINFALKSSKLGDLIDSKSRSAIDRVVQQIGFLGQQLFERGRFYSKGLVEDVASHFRLKCYYDEDGYPSAEYGLLKGCFIHGLDPYEELVHSISTREIIVRSSRGLSEPGTLFKNLMAILRDVVICYDGTVRNVCSNSVIQFDYGKQAGDATRHLFPPGEPVGVLAATSMSNPAYKAVLDASPSSTNSWELMKEILLCKVNFRNEPIDRRVILYLNDCSCRRTYCRENAAYLVKNQLGKVSLKDAAVEFIIEYQQQRSRKENSETDAGLVGHIHLNEVMLKKLKINMVEVFQRCQERIKSFFRKKKVNQVFKMTELDVSDSCSFSHSSEPCVMFLWRGGDKNDLDTTANILADIICPALLETIIKGDPRISSANIIWVNPDTNTWVRNPSKAPNGELALDITLEKAAVKQSGDAWRIVLDSCLPVLHLIDTRRSIPYAIKQIQELFGISCTFDQAIQRLAASVKMVAKGVLREHLLLLASSMTCGGNLVGFNTGGYKALARQLNIQVPFTDATLFTPRKCFERAAEKCHTDSLSSVVASCSWGKHVAVGTGSRFDLLWKAEQMKSNEIGGMDVYNFLHMVKSVTNGEEENNACLGDDIDDLLEEEDMEFGMSPEHNAGFDAVFEENFELLNGSASNGWDANTDQNEAKSNDWSAWGKNKTINQDGGSGSAQEDSWSRGIGKGDVQDDSNAWDANTSQIKEKSNSWSGWGGQKSGAQDGGSGSAHENSWSRGIGKADVRDDSNAWDANTAHIKEKSNNWSGWGEQKSGAQDGLSENTHEDSWSYRMGKTDVHDSRSSAWDANTDKTKEKPDNLSGWGGNQSGVKDGGSKIAREGPWCSKKPIQEEFSKSGDWDGNTSQAKTQSNDWSAWGTDKSGKQDNRSERVLEDSWRPQKLKSDVKEDFSMSNAWDENRKQLKTQSNEWSSGRKHNSQIMDDSSERVQQDSWSSAMQKDVIQEDSARPSAWNAVRDQTKTKPCDWSDVGRKSEIQDSSWKDNAWDAKMDQINSTSNDWLATAKNKFDEQDGNSKRTQKYSWSSPKPIAWETNKDHMKTSSNDWLSKTRNESKVQESADEKAHDDSWGTHTWKADDKVNVDATHSDETRSCAWDANTDQTKASSTSWSTWGSNIDKTHDAGMERTQDNSSSFGKWKAEQKVGADVMQEDSSQSKEIDLNWDAKMPVDNSPWGRPKSPKGQAWNSQNESNQAASSGGWDSQMESANSDSDRNYQWGKQGRGESFKKNRFEASQGWGPNAGERKNKGRPPRAPGSRLDLYTHEEQDVLKDIEPIMQSIRRIMQLQGYNDGDPLASDDQTFILENVFEHHPDKESKMGDGVDHVMISRHSNFQESRCFYVVSKDGRRQDFSYRKCLENLVKKKYPDLAESFVGKFFWKPRSRPDPAPSPGLTEQAGEPTPTPGLTEQAGEQPQTPGVTEQAVVQTPAPDSNE